MTFDLLEQIRPRLGRQFRIEIERALLVDNSKLLLTFAFLAHGAAMREKFVEPD